MFMKEVKGKVSLYSYADNDLNGNFGTAVTASGINIDPKQYTAAVQMRGRDGLNIGDVLLVQKGDKEVIVLATDVGGLPHAVVDIVDGKAGEALNMDLKRKGSATYVATVDGRHDPQLNQGYTVKRIGHVQNIRNQHDGNGNARDGSKAQEVLQTIKDINEGRKDIEALKSVEGIGATIPYDTKFRLEKAGPPVPSSFPKPEPDEQPKRNPVQMLQDMLKNIPGLSGAMQMFEQLARVMNQPESQNVASATQMTQPTQLPPPDRSQTLQQTAQAMQQSSEQLPSPNVPNLKSPSGGISKA